MTEEQIKRYAVRLMIFTFAVALVSLFGLGAGIDLDRASIWVPALGICTASTIAFIAISKAYIEVE